MKKQIFSVFFIITTFSINVWSVVIPTDHHSAVKVQKIINQKDWSFVENKGQVESTDIKYYGHQGGVYLYCKPGMLSFVFTKTEKAPEQISEATGTSEDGRGDSHFTNGAGGFDRSSLSALRTSISRTDLVLLNSNPSAEITASDKQEYYENFYLAYTPEVGITNVRTYKTITYKSIYPHIDMVLQVKEKGMEYSFIVHPGGKVSDIQLQWNGAEGSQALANGGFKFSNSLGTIEESAPKSFAEGKLVTSKFEKNGFKVGNYNDGKDLIIDPNLLWATYFGYTGIDEVTATCISDSGYTFIAGNTTSSSHIATSGALESSYGGGTEAFFAKFNKSGKLLWGTYFDNASTETAACADNSGNVYFTGSIGAVSFILKLNPSGSQVWNESLSSSGQVFTQGMSLDHSGYLYITGYANDSGLATSSAHQTASNGYYNAFLAKFNTSGTEYWATYFGGENNDYGYSVSADLFGNVYIAGSTYSATGIATKGIYQSVLKGYEDGFVAKFSSGGTFDWGSYFGGPYYNEIRGVSTDPDGNIYIAGFTQSATNIATTGAYQTSYEGADDGFLAKFNSSGGISWSTYFGGSGDDKIYGLDIDRGGNIYVAGTTSSSTNIAISNGFQTTFGRGNYDGFIVKFTTQDTVSWASYYGGDGDDYLLGLGVNDYGDVCFAGYTGSISHIATSGAFQTSYFGNYDGFFMKFHTCLNDAGITSEVNPASPFCEGNRKVSVDLRNYGIVELDSVTISWSLNNKFQKFYKWKGKLKPGSTTTVDIDSVLFKAGTDTFKSWTSYPNGIVDSFAQNDTLRIIDSIKPLPAAYTGGNRGLCLGDGIQLGGNSISGHTYYWKSTPAGITGSNSGIYVAPTINTSYTLRETVASTGCTATNSLKVTINPKPTVSIDTPRTICPGAKIYIGVSPVKGHSYSWTSNPSGFTSISSSPQISAEQNTLFTLTLSVDSSGCTAKDSVIISIYTVPKPGKIANTAICYGNKISLGKNPVPGLSYSWASSPYGFSSTVSNPSVIPLSTTTYYLTETVDSLGCKVTDSVNIIINPLPVPNLVSTVSVCSGSSVSIGDYSISGYSYQWYSYPGGFSSTDANPSVNPTLSSKYVLSEAIKSTGCKASDTVSVTVNPKPASNFSFNTVCMNDSTIFTNKSTGGNTYSWTFGDGFTSSNKNPKHAYTTKGNYKIDLTTINSYGCKDSLVKTIGVSPCVWPGDANNDKVVDMKDLLAIGVSYGAAGHLRPSANINWTGQISPDWDSSFTNGVNYKHADCNGDSLINYYDTLAISANYSLSHTKSRILNQGDTSDPLFTIRYLKDTVNTGDTVVAQITLGNNSKPVSSLYGLIFSLSFDPSLFQINKAFLKMNPSFLGTGGYDLLTMSKKYFSAGNLDLGICRTDRLDTSGTGVIATLYLPVNTTLPQKYVKTGLAVFNNFQISHNENAVPLYFNLDSVVLKYHNNGIQSPGLSNSIGLNIFPNPFQSNLTVSYNLDQKSRIKMDIFDLEGKQIASIINEEEVPGAHQFAVNAEKYHLNPGVYLLKFIVNDEVESRRLVKF